MKRDTAGKFVSNWDSGKKQRVSISITHTAWQLLDDEAKKRGISRSEVIEQVARSLGEELSREKIDARQTCEEYKHTQFIASQTTGRQVAAILESITDAFVAFDRNWCYTYVNHAATKILHKTPDELIGKHVWDEVFPELIGGVAYQALHQAVAQQIPVSWEEFGEPVGCWLEINAYPSAEGVAVYFRDITERKIAEAERERLLQELETEHARFEAVLRQLPAGVLIADAASGKLVLANEQAKQIVGYSYQESLELEEYVPITPFVAFHSDGHLYAPDEYPLARSLQKGEVVCNEEMELQSDGTQTFISVNSAPILNSQNQVVAAVAIFQDITERKQIETAIRQQAEALKNQHKWLEAVLDLMPTPMVFIEPVSAKITFANRIANELAGGDLPKNKSLDEYANAYYCTDAEGKQIPTERIPAVLLARGEHLENYQVNWHTSGGIRSTLCWGETLPEMYGHPATCICIFQDVTKLKQIEENLRQTEERLQLALSSAQIIAWDVDLITNRVVCSPNALAIWGLKDGTAEDFIAKIHRDDQPQVMEIAQRAAATETVYQQEYRLIDPSGTLRWLHSQGKVYLDAAGKGVRMVGVSVDITERKQAEQERARLERNQRFLSEASAVLASSLDYQTTLERVAQLAVPELADWCSVHIVKEDNSIDQIAVAHIDPAKLQWAEQIKQKYPLNPDAPRGSAWTLRTGKSDLLPDIPDEFLVQAAQDPEHLEILRSIGFKSVMTVPLRTQDRILGVISFISAESGQRYDQSSLQLAEELAHHASLAIDNAQLYRRSQSDRAKAEAANRVKDEFLAVLSHELRSPLNPILGWTKLLRSKRLDSAKADQALETIERNAKLQVQLIEDLLDVSRILQGKMSLNVAPVNLPEIIEAAIETVQLAAEAKNIHVTTILNPISKTVSGDANRLQQVVWNLVSNAVKFTPSRGRVEVQLQQIGMYAQIQVKDTGIGISPEFLPHVFEYFRQQDSAMTRRFGGLGLGLAIVRHLTQLHGGTVEAASPGENLGAIFTITLPLNVAEPEVPSAPNPLESTINLKGVRILVVDDEPDMRDLAQFILTQAGADVVVAGSALEALTLFNQSVPDLLISDIGMPEMDGYSLIRQIREYSPQQGGNVLAIALSAYAGEINQKQALQAGFQKHIAKPIVPDELVRAIALLIESLK